MRYRTTICRLIGHRWVDATGGVTYHHDGVRSSWWSDPRISHTGYPNGRGCKRCWRFEPDDHVASRGAS